jgi:ribosomal-protein-alanine N-acetyltransferase
MEIRPMAEKDIEQVWNMENEIFTTPWSMNSFESSINSMDNIYLVAEEEGDIIGYCGLWGTIDEGQITNIAVREDRRGQHVGNKLLETLIEYGREMGLNAFTLEVRTSNEAAINLYHKFNFEDSGIRKDYYQKPVEDALIMWLRFDYKD